MPVEYDVVEERFPDELEVAVYYVASEALTQRRQARRGGRRAGAVAVVDATLVLEVADDGRGGAVAGGGSGLIGLNDRVEALRGRLT